MADVGARALTEAREWLGTPYCHQASAKGGGADCLGLIRGVWRGLYGAEGFAIPAYTPDWAEAQGVEALWQGLSRHMAPAPLGALTPGDVVLFRMLRGRVAKHLGLISATGTAPRFIHAYSGHGVVESPLSDPWRRRIAARFQFPTHDA